MRSRWNWTRPSPHIYSYNREAAEAGYNSSVETSSRSARATSVAASSGAASTRVARATTVAPSQTGLTGYSGFYGRQLALLNDRNASATTAAKYDAAFTASSSSARTTSVQEKTTTSVQNSSKFDSLMEQKRSIEYGKASKSAALRRAEIHAQNSGKDPRHVPVPRNVDDDICKLVADIHLSPYTGRKEIDSASRMSQQGRLKVDRMEKELSALTSSAMSYKSMYAKSASQMASEAMAACNSEATSSKKIRKTVVESSSKRVAAA